MIRIGITGHTGLVGPHLKSLLDAYNGEYPYILISREDLADLEKLRKKLLACDAVVHLAGLSNRADQKEIYPTNIGLTRKILDELQNADHRPRIVFLSSVHRDKDTPYGRSKRDCELLIEEWGRKNNVKTTAIVSPHIFGESPHIWGGQYKLYTNSAFATFCHELIQEKESVVHAFAPIELAYAGDVCASILDVCCGRAPEKIIHLKGKETQVKEVYELLKYFRDEYLERRTPVLKDTFESNCYKAFLSYI